MFCRHFVGSLALILFIHALSPAQSAATQEQTKTEQEEARKALEQKALSLLDEVVTDAQTLKLATNRIHIQIAAADLIWSRDEKRARPLFEKSIKDFFDLIAGIDNSDPYYYTLIQAPTQLYTEMLQVLVKHDPQMALDFLHHTHLPQPPQTNPRYTEQSYELPMSLQIANQIAGKDPKLAEQIGMESLDKGFSPNIVNLLTQLQEKDREGAAKLSSALIKKLLSENLLNNNEAAGVAINLLSMASRIDAHGSTANGKQPANPSPLIDAQAYRDLMEVVLSAALLSPTSSNPSDWRERSISTTLLFGLQGLMPEIEKIAPARAAALQRKLADLRKSLDPASRFWQDNQEVLQKGTVDDILGLASKVAPEVRDQLYQQAAWKALSQGDSERARQIVNDNVSNPISRRQMLDEVERQITSKAVAEGKLEQARQGLARLRTNEERAMMLTQIANTLSVKGDKKVALQLLEEARTLVGNRAENYNQIQVQLQVARALAPLEPARSFEMLEAITGQLNELLSAAEVLNGFDQQYFKDGELIWQGTSLSNTLSLVMNDLGQLAPADFDRAQDIAGRFQRTEARLMAQLSIATAVLSDKSQNNLPLGGRGISFGRVMVVN